MEQVNIITQEINSFINSRIIQASIIFISILIIKDFFSALASNFVDGFFYFFDTGLGP